MCLHRFTSRSSMTMRSCAGHSAGSCEALLADTKHPQFDCLVLDIELGGMSGIELAERLVADGCSTPLIFITAHEHLNARARAQLPGAAGYFRKIDAGADVLDVIRRCVSTGSQG